jgi:hypothetical protein
LQNGSMLLIASSTAILLTKTFIKHVLILIRNLFEIYTAINRKQKFVSHVDNSLTNKSKAFIYIILFMPICFSLCLIYSTDLILSDMFLFGHIEKRIEG